MKTKTYLAFMAVVGTLLLSGSAFSQDYKNRYVKDTENKRIDEIDYGYRQIVTPAYDDGTVAPNDPHVKVIGWDPAVPLSRFINNIKEGETDQLTVLRLLSAPNIIWRDPVSDEEKWVYHWIWSYENEWDPNHTIIYMNHSGKRLIHNQHPVSMVITFNRSDVVDHYSVRLLKVHHDTFDEY